MPETAREKLGAAAGHNLRAELARKGWFHSFEFPDGRVIEGIFSIAQLRNRLAQFPIPEDLTGKRVLDIGAWDGWFSFEMERRGAEVVAVDCVEQENFRYAHRQLGSKVDYRIMDVYELSPEKLGRFDIVLFLEVLYHLKHPLLGLEKVCALTREMACIESIVMDAATEGQGRPGGAWMEFYETDELCGQADNWVGPNLECLLALCRTAGFARVTLQNVAGNSAHVTCYRQWEPVPAAATQPAPILTGVAHGTNYGINFDSRRDEYLCCWFTTPEQALTRDNVRPEVGGYGVRPIFVGRLENAQWQANFKFPPGLEPGWHSVRLRTASSPFSNALQVAVDMPPGTTELSITRVCDGRSLQEAQIQLDKGGIITCWLKGLPENADRNNIRARLGDHPLVVDYVSSPDAHGLRQVNARVPSIAHGNHSLVVSCGQAESVPIPVLVKAREQL